MAKRNSLTLVHLPFTFCKMIAVEWFTQYANVSIEVGTLHDCYGNVKQIQRLLKSPTHKCKGRFMRLIVHLRFIFIYMGKDVVCLR